MKPVTELYEAAEEAAGSLHNDYMSEMSRHKIGDALLKRICALDKAAGGMGTPRLLEVLDRVATSNRLDLVRWAAGLDTADALAVLDALVDAHGRERNPAVARLRDGLMAALSGGDGDKKCGECAGTGKVKRLEGSGSIRVVKYDPCPKCAEGEGGAKEAASTLQACKKCPVWGCTAVEPCTDALAEMKPKPTILRAGKPPPFLRVGMVLVDPRGHGTLTLWSLDMARDTWLCRGSRDGVFERERASVLLTWLLAEPFTVEGES